MCEHGDAELAPKSHLTSIISIINWVVFQMITEAETTDQTDVLK